MPPMSSSLSWTDLALRLALTVLVGLAIGYNRSEHGKAAGMSTMVLVCLAASAAMLQVNQLLPTIGKAPDSYVTNDLMRLPLGILTGVGFIGGGAILRRGDIVVGVTTAATLWLVTVIGLCIGGGQIALGLATTAIGLFALWMVKWVEGRLCQERLSRLTVELDEDGPDEADLRRRLDEAGMRIATGQFSWDRPGDRRRLVFDLRDDHEAADTVTPSVITSLAASPGVIKVDWQPV